MYVRVARGEIREFRRGCRAPGLLRPRRDWVLQAVDSQGGIPADRRPVAAEDSDWQPLEDGVGGARPRPHVCG